MGGPMFLMALQPIPRVPPHRRLSRLERAEKTIADAKEFYVAGELDLDEFEDVVDREYRRALRIPKTPEQLAAEMLARGVVDVQVFEESFEPVEFVGGDGRRWTVPVSVPGKPRLP